MLPNHRLLARAFHRTSTAIVHGPHALPKHRPSSPTHLSNSASVSVGKTRTNRFSNARILAKWEGTSKENHATESKAEKDTPLRDGAEEGAKERAATAGNEEGPSRATSESSGGSVEKAKSEAKSDGVEKNAGIGMQDEKGH